MKNVNMVEMLIEAQKLGANVFLTEEGLQMFLELMKTQNNGLRTVQKVG